MSLLKAAKIADVPPGAVKVVELGDDEIALCNVDGHIYAIANLCTHDGAPLDQGRLDGHAVECPRHGARFDVRTGSVLALPAVLSVPTYPVHLRGDDIMVEIDQSPALPEARDLREVHSRSTTMPTQDKIMTALKQVFDPEIGVNVVDLGLIRSLDVDEAHRRVHVDLTLTSPGCPMGPQMIRDVRTELARLPGIDQVEVDLVWSPPWHPSMMSDAAKDELGYDEELGLGYTN